MNFLKDHDKLRALIIGLFFIIGMVLTIVGWRMTGKMTGLIIMLIGIVFLLAALLVYNSGFKK